ncbi:MAG: hypothetical protein RB148_11740 [Armatimonadota bacterium]|nr:hypothetical protein [Armatimonadota bacterium]
MTQRDYFELRIDGPGVYPETVPLHHLVDLLTNVETLVRELVGDDAKEDLMLSLPAVETGSSRYKIWSNYPEETRAALREVERALAVGHTEDLPERVQKSVSRIAAVGRQLNRATVELYPDPSNRKIVARILPAEDEPESEPTKVTGRTTIYGRLVRVGGVEPRARLELTTGEVISCKVSQSLARALGSRLYERVGVVGVATWDASDWHLLSFTVEELLPYQEVPLKVAFQELADAAGPEAWTDKRSGRT